MASPLTASATPFLHLTTSLSCLFLVKPFHFLLSWLPRARCFAQEAYFFCQHCHLITPRIVGTYLLRLHHELHNLTRGILLRREGGPRGQRQKSRGGGGDRRPLHLCLYNASCCETSGATSNPTAGSLGLYLREYMATWSPCALAHPPRYRSRDAAVAAAQCESQGTDTDTCLSQTRPEAGQESYRFIPEASQRRCCWARLGIV